MDPKLKTLKNYRSIIIGLGILVLLVPLGVFYDESLTERLLVNKAYLVVACFAALLILVMIDFGLQAQIKPLLESKLQAELPLEIVSRAKSPEEEAIPFRIQGILSLTKCHTRTLGNINRGLWGSYQGIAPGGEHGISVSGVYFSLPLPQNLQMISWTARPRISQSAWLTALLLVPLICVG